MTSVLRCLCALSIAVPSGVAPRSSMARGPEGVAPETSSPAPQEPGTEPGTDELHQRMLAAFAEHFTLGKAHFNRGAYALAAAEFELAFAAYAAEAGLRNVVVSLERVGDDVGAANAARRYLALPACDTPDIDQQMCASHRHEIEPLLESLLERIAELRLEVAEGVTLREIRINGRLTALPDFPMLIAPGRVDIELQGETAAQRRQRVIEVRAGENKTILVDSFEAPVRVPDDRDPVVGGPPKPRGKWLRPTFWTGVGLTAASGVALGTLGGLTLVSRRAYRREVERFNDGLSDCMPDTMAGTDCYPHAEEDQFLRRQDATNILIGVTAGLATLTAIVGAVAFTRPRGTGRSRASTRTRVTFDGTGIAVRW